MSIYMIGGGGTNEPPFNRAFFTTRLGDIIERTGKERIYKLVLYLVDGTTLEVCNIDDLSDQTISLRAFNKKDETCDLSVNVVPYGVIYRLELSPKESEENERVGFRWTPEADKKLRKK